LLTSHVCTLLRKSSKQTESLSTYQDDECIIPEISCYHKKYQGEASVMQQTSRELGVIKKVAGSTWTKAGESSEQTSMVNSREENRSNICKVVDGKLLISALYGMHALTMTEHTTVLKVRV
jgi:hypothetical protein